MRRPPKRQKKGGGKDESPIGEDRGGGGGKGVLVCLGKTQQHGLPKKWLGLPKPFMRSAQGSEKGRGSIVSKEMLPVGKIGGGRGRI